MNIISILFLLTFAHASRVKVVKPQLEIQNASLAVNYGDKNSIFYFRKMGKEYQVSTDGFRDKSKSLVLTPKNSKYLLRNLKEASRESPNDKTFCPRRKIELRLENHLATLGCIGSTTPVAVKLTQLANDFNVLRK